MKKFKNKFTYVASTLLLSTLILGACGNNSGTEDSGSKDSTVANGNETTLTWALWDKDATVYYEPLVEAFEDDNPGVNIELLDLGSTDFMTVLGTQLSGGDDSIDIVTIKDIPGYASLVNKNQLEPLSELTKDVDLNQYSGTVEQITVDDEFYGLPFRSDFYVMYYNKDLFDAAKVDYPQNGITFDEYDKTIREVSEKATEANGEKVYGGHYHTWRSQVQLYGILDGKNTLVSDDYSFLEPVYEKVLAQQDDEIVQDYAALKTSSLHYSAAFYQNNVASLVMGTWFIPTLSEAISSGESEDFEWGIATMPLTNNAPEGTAAGTITSLGISSNSKNKEEAYKFVEFVSSEKGAQIIAETGTMPAIQTEEVINTITSNESFPSDEQSKDALQVETNYLELPLDEHAAEVETILNDAHDNIMTKNAAISYELKNVSEQVVKLK
ncbi:extracellular solute-binding protein [Jeotgalibaca sp. MA1X17-3]|uniref:ABC transporter substrate-binding protein n=1 Tax=Jeotgalibaca sp. MA1X17-3 TaxID=2908211 RepID=UPI001F39AC04|nr:extracellular solute-binding protein [Jeotgalibaca sp. MA1X17-3]UJF15693.1 extracellular solute-binding protein [Jeotgalibaca sp. MA1X17-3]